MELIALSENLVVGAGITGWVEDMVGSVENLVRMILGVVGLIVAVMIIIKNPTVGRSIIGICVGAFIAGLPWIVPAMGDMFRGDIEGSGAGAPHAVVVEEEMPSTTFES